MTPEPEPDPDPPTPTPTTISISVADGGSNADYTVALKGENSPNASSIRSTTKSGLPVDWGIDYTDPLYLYVAYSNSLRLPELRINGVLNNDYSISGNIRYHLVALNSDASPISITIKLMTD